MGSLGSLPYSHGLPSVGALNRWKEGQSIHRGVVLNNPFVSSKSDKLHEILMDFFE